MASSVRLAVPLFIAGILALIGMTCPTPAFAVTGREAVGICIDSTAGGGRCAWSVNAKGEIDICNKSGCVTCPSAEGTCVTAARGRPRPNLGLPSGSTVTTAVGTFKVSPREFNGSLLRAPASQVAK